MNAPQQTQEMESVRSWHLMRQEELRIEVDKDVKITLKMTDGTGEIFGTELAKDRAYTFTRCKFALFSWHGCTIEVTGQCHAYVGKETPMNAYMNVHGMLEEMRDMAERTDKQGPRVMIVGPTDTGKSSLSRILASYAARLGRTPTVVDLDVGQGSSVPGMIASLPIEKPVDVSEGYEFATPLVYWYGDVTPGSNPDLYKLQVSNLLRDINRRMELNQAASVGGLIVNTCGWIDGVGYELIRQAIDATRATVVLVLDNERLYSDLQQDLSQVQDRRTQVIKLYKSGGVVTRDPNFRRQTRVDKIREYFYGPSGDLSPHSTLIDFADISIYRIGGGPRAPSSALPIGAERTITPTKLVEVQPSQEIVHSIIGVSHAKTPEALLETNLAGFLYITDVNVEKKKLTVLAPCPGPLPSRFVVVGALKWYE